MWGFRPIEVIVRNDVQLAADPLLPLEKFNVGGAFTVRGYRENLLVRDNGLAASVELRSPVYRTEAGGSAIQLAVFTDYGRSWSHKGPDPGFDDIASAGIAVRLELVPKLRAVVSKAFPFRNVDNPGYDLQDDGINFQVSYDLF